MERKSNVSAWQLRLFDGFDRDIMVMQRDEEEVFDNAIHVFFDREYYDAYVSKATKYGNHKYAYHEDKLGEVVNQVFEENIAGIVFHLSGGGDVPKGVLCDEKYLAQKDMVALKEAADSYHYLYTTATQRCTKEETVARLWTKNVYIIGTLPDIRIKPKEGEKQAFELMTLRRKENGEAVTGDDYDYESLKVFLTPESAMLFNPDKKPINKYKLGFISNIVKKKLRVVIEPHRNYWFEYDPATIDISEHFKVPKMEEEDVQARIQEFVNMDKVYTLLAYKNSDYMKCFGNPFLMSPDGKNILMYLFEKYEDAVSFAVENQNMLPVFDSTYPIGVLEKNSKHTNLNVILAIAKKIGVTVVNLDMDTMKMIGVNINYFEQVSGLDFELENILEPEILKNVAAETDGKINYRMPAIPFKDTKNEFVTDEERKQELISHLDNDYDNGMVYLANCSIMDMLVFYQEVLSRYKEAVKAENEEERNHYLFIRNKVTVLVTEALCEVPYVYTLKNDDGSFAVKNGVPYLIVTDRYESNRNSGGKLMPASIDNEQFMNKLKQNEAGEIVAITDGPGVIELFDPKLMADIAIQWKKAEPVREELMIYLTQGCNFTYQEADYYYKRLKADSSIFVEFVSTVRNGEYPPMGMITVDGINAKDIAEKEGLNFLQAYDNLLSLKEKSNVKEENSDQDESEDKKGLFGKIFKK